MKKFKFLTLALAALALAACSKTDDGPNGPEPFDGTEAWVKLSISSGSSTLSRALNTPNFEAGTANETTISNVRILFFNASNVVVEDMTFVSGADEIGTPGQPLATLAGDAFKVPGSVKGVVVIANPLAALPGTTKGSTTYDAWNVARSEAGALTAMTSAGAFMMTNAQGVVEPVTIYKTEAEANAAPNSIYIDRVSAKVRLNATATSGTANVTISNVDWRLNVTNKQYFPVSVRTKTYLETTARGCITPYDRWKIGSYRIDPNYVYTTPATAPTYPSTAYNAHYNYFTNATPPSSWIGLNTWEYCLENTQDQQGNYHAYTTQALIKATYAPTAFYVPGGTTTSVVDAQGDWLKITANNGLGGATQHTFYTQATLIEWITYELTQKYLHHTPADYLTPITTAYNAYLAALQAKSVAGVTAVTIPTTMVEATAADQADATAALFSGQDAAVKAHGADMAGAVSYYKGGLSYYKVMVKHDNDTNTGNNQLGEFGVVRNSQYDINITRFDSPGFPIIPDPDPDTPDEDDEGWLAVEIHVNPWTWYTQDEIL